MASLSAITSYACQGTQGLITLVSVDGAPGASDQVQYSWVVRAGDGLDYGGPAQAGSVAAVPDGECYVRVFADYADGSTALSTPRTYQVSCAGNSGGTTCTIKLEVTRISSPTSAGGYGQIAYRLSGCVDKSQHGELRRVSDGQIINSVQPSGDGEYTAPISPEGVGVDLLFTVYEEASFTADTCRAQASLTVPAFVEQVDPTPVEAVRWEPVGGVLSNPVLLKVEALLTDAAGAPRPGLHVQLELWRLGALTPFRSFRATVRTATQHVDAAPYLRAELVGQLRYAGQAPLVDADACLRFFYRYRIADANGVEPWVTRAGERYAVLAALPGTADTMAPYVADGTGRVASIFPSGEATQFVGYPLEVSVLLPPYSVPRWAELRYLDGYGNAVEIRSLPLASDLPPGLLRIPLPADPPVCATQLEVSVRDDDRSFQSTCGNVIPTPPASTRGTFAHPIYDFY